MSAPDAPNALVRLLEERPENWRALADLAIDFAPPQVARAAGQVMTDPSADPRAVLDAIRSVPAIVLDDTPLDIGSIEPETLDFAPVSTITDDVYFQEADLDLDFGAGTFESSDLIDQSFPVEEAEEFDEEVRSPEFDHALTGDPFEAQDEGQALGLDDDFDDDLDDEGDGDDGDHLDVGD